MQKILRRRALRELRSHLVRYIMLGLLILASVFMLVSLLGAAEIVIRGVRAHAEANRVEDGEFRTFAPLTEENMRTLEDAGAELEEQFYLDFKDERGAVLRVFRIRERINLAELLTGAFPEKENEIVLERRFCEVNAISPGDTVTLGGNIFTVTGIATTPDYDSPVRNMTDSTVDSKTFGTAFVTEKTYAMLRDAGTAEGAESFVYAYRRNGEITDREIRKIIEDFPFNVEDIEDKWFKRYYREQTDDIAPLLDMAELFAGKNDSKELKDGLGLSVHNLQEFVTRADNMRIEASAADLYINLYGCLVAGVIILALFAYVLAVFIMHSIDEDSSVIGTLYALGVTRRDLLLHYMILPVAITFLCGVLGTMAGYTSFGIGWQMMDTYNYYSVPEIPITPVPYIIVYGVVIPPLMAAAVNFFVIRKKLSQTALSLLRHEKREVRVHNLDLDRFGFAGGFRIRQTLRETRVVLTVLAGLLISLTLVWIGLDCLIMCKHVQNDSVRDTKYEYMYYYKYPEPEVPEGGVSAYAKSLKKERFGYDLDVTLLGIGPDNPYFPLTLSDRMDEVVISSAMAQKYDIREGDEVTLRDEEKGLIYAFRVAGITQFSPAFYAFMDIDALREMDGAGKDAYNVVFSDHELPVESGRLYATTTKEDIKKASDVFINLLMSMIYFMTGFSALIFVIVMYLMLSVLVDHSMYDISLMKIFGYRDGEVRKLYLNGSMVLIAVGTVPMIAISKRIIDSLYPYFISNVACAMDLSMSPFVYLLIYLIIIGLCFLIIMLLQRKIRRISPNEILKHRE